MNCGFPIWVNERLRPCGKCQGCARKRRNSWVGRMVMEQTQHKECAFVTLTYDEANLPLVHQEENDVWIPTLVKSHVQRWIRSVRKKATRYDRELRYFAAGEYGDKSGRPHYHLIVFGTGPFWNQIYAESWNKGFVSSYEATPASMAYVAKYCLKGGKDPELDLPVHGEWNAETPRITTPPFRLTSRRPAIGTTYAPIIAMQLARDTGHGLSYDPAHNGPVNQIRFQGKKYPLDRLMKDHLGEQLSLRGVNHFMLDAMLNRDYPEPTNEEVFKARQRHNKALRSRESRLKL